MKKVEATISPSRLDAVCDALVDEGITGITASEIRTYDPATHSYRYRGAEFSVPFAPRVKIETVVDDGQVARCVAAIRRNVTVDDGDHVVVFTLEDAVRIRTGESAARAA
jgi:nitrogen regulatory protein P-II 1